MLNSKRTCQLTVGVAVLSVDQSSSSSEDVCCSVGCVVLMWEEVGSTNVPVSRRYSSTSLGSSNTSLQNIII